MRYDPLVTVAEDLQYLQRTWMTNPPDDELRRGSAILRRLLVEQVLAKAWRAVGCERQPVIIAPDLLAVLPYDRSQVTLACAGGAKVNGMQIAGACMLEQQAGAPPPTRRADWSPGSNAGVAVSWPLSSYLESPALIVHGELVGRREVIKYFANILGGVHLDLSSRTRKREEELVHRMTTIEERVRFLDKHALPLELLSIGQAVASAPDIDTLIRRIGSRSAAV